MISPAIPGKCYHPAETKSLLCLSCTGPCWLVNTTFMQETVKPYTSFSAESFCIFLLTQEQLRVVCPGSSFALNSTPSNGFSILLRAWNLLIYKEASDTTGVFQWARVKGRSVIMLPLPSEYETARVQRYFIYPDKNISLFFTRHSKVRFRGDVRLAHYDTNLFKQEISTTSLEANDWKIQGKTWDDCEVQRKGNLVIPNKHL